MRICPSVTMRILSRRAGLQISSRQNGLSQKSRSLYYRISCTARNGTGSGGPGKNSSEPTRIQKYSVLVPGGFVFVPYGTAATENGIAWGPGVWDLVGLDLEMGVGAVGGYYG